MAKNQSNNDIDFEIQFYESILKESPDFIETMMALADLYTKKGLYREGLELDERLSRLRPEEPVIFYNLACSYSLLNDQYAALNAIRRAIELGYDDFEHLSGDKDLAHLMADEQFKQYLKDIQKKQKSPKVSLPKKE
jgi:tetratricopeptide (TPR) repeat protein